MDALNKHMLSLNNAIISDRSVIKLLILNWDEEKYGNGTLYIQNRIFVSTGQIGKMAVLACNRLVHFGHVLTIKQHHSVFSTRCMTIYQQSMLINVKVFH